MLLTHALLAVFVLAAMLALLVAHLPPWLLRLLLRVPPWLQALILHFGYAGWLGGVTGHLMGAPLAAVWYGLWTLWLRPRLVIELAHNTGSVRRRVVQVALRARQLVARVWRSA